MEKVRVGHETMIQDISEGRKQVLDITARNEARPMEPKILP
jgi:hypothetical protein